MDWKIYSETFSRNIGLISKEDQKVISEAVVAIAGTGADGGLSAERIARMGVKKIKLSDPEKFDLSNINRQFGATISSVGKNKCLTVAEEINRIRPDIEIETYPEGINEENAKKFVEGSNVILDEIEYTTPSASVFLHIAAIKVTVDVFAGLNLGVGINIFRFTPSGLFFEDMIGFSNASRDKEFRMESMVPNIPSYVEKEIVKLVLERKSFVPTISPTIGLLSGYLSFLAMGKIIKKWDIPCVPNFLHVDMYNQELSIKKI